MAVDAEKPDAGSAGQYVEAGGVKTWFDAWGAGSPLVLMHGDLVGNGPWEPMVPSLAERFRVLAPERRGHGHTPDIEGDLTYWLLAEDMIAFMLIMEKPGVVSDLVLDFLQSDPVATLMPIRRA